jgi:hypothetical protein
MNAFFCSLCPVFKSSRIPSFPSRFTVLCGARKLYGAPSNAALASGTCFQQLFPFLKHFSASPPANWPLIAESDAAKAAGSLNKQG